VSRLRDGKIVAVDAYNSAIVVARFHPDGTLDEGFGRRGSAITEIGENPLEFPRNARVYYPILPPSGGGGDWQEAGRSRRKSLVCKGFRDSENMYFVTKKHQNQTHHQTHQTPGVLVEAVYL